MIDHLIQWVEVAPPGIAFTVVIIILLLCGLGFPLPEELPLVLAGYLVYAGEVRMTTCLIVTFLALLAGDSLLFFIGYKFGNRIFKMPVLRKLMTPERVQKANEKFHHYGNRVVFIARFMAGVRGTVFLTAGILRMPYRRFILFDGLAALISAPLLIYIAYHFGDEIQHATKVIKKTGWTLFGVAAVLIVSISLLVVWMRKRRHAKIMALRSARRTEGQDNIVLRA